MKQKDIESLSVKELKEKLHDEKGNLSKLKLNHKISPVENPMTIRSARKLVARLSTELTKKNKASK
ncbi:MAG TPA: 50S ribosomal protein L29 [Bacteroidia bacterium]|jgi:large subunit ribosomal protein L29|nr:50S ribosomal protein L29 [Bacteroidia bacterium]